VLLEYIFMILDRPPIAIIANEGVVIGWKGKVRRVQHEVRSWFTSVYNVFLATEGEEGKERGRRKMRRIRR
jgi:hypothetical protein